MTRLDHTDLDHAELLLAPEWTLLPDGPARDHAVVVRDGVFADVGPREAVTGRHPHLTPVRVDDTLLMPGLVDTHHHLTQSFGKALVFGEPSEIFRRVWVPLEGSLDEERAYLAAKLAALESLRGGFTTVCEAGTRMEADVGVVADATRDAGIRCVLGMICNDLRPDGAAEPPDAVLARAQAHLARYARPRPRAPVPGDLDPGGRDATAMLARRRRSSAADAEPSSRPMSTSTWPPSSARW